MKNLSSKMMVAALALTGVASLASAQQLKSEIPFPFRVSGTLMPAGSYEISESTSNSSPIFRMLNTDVHRPVLVVPNGNIGSATSFTDTKLVFRCGDMGCALAQIWTGQALGAYSVPTPKRVTHDEVSMLTVKAERTK